MRNRRGWQLLPVVLVQVTKSVGVCEWTIGRAGHFRFDVLVEGIVASFRYCVRLCYCGVCLSCWCSVCYPVSGDFRGCDMWNG